MKSKRRHDLETNELAKRLAVWGERVKPYSKFITVTIAAAAVVLVVWLVASRIAAAQRQRAWDVYVYAMTSADSDYGALREAAEEHEGTAMGEWASITWADAELRLATRDYFQTDSDAQEHLDNAMDAYRRLIDESDDEEIKNRARLGMARALETDGKVKEAIEFYAAVEGPFALFADQRAKQLASPAAYDAIQWLATAEMPRVQPPAGPGTPGVRPPFGSDFSLDPEIPPQSSAPFSSGLEGPLMPGETTGGAANQDVAQPPLEIQNPFAGPSDPDRYAAPPQDPQESDGQPPTPPPSDDAPAGPQAVADEPHPEEGE